MIQCSPCYSAVSALLRNHLPDRSNYSPLYHTHYSLRINTSLVSSGQTLYQAGSWRLILQSSLLQRFTAESSQELSALRKLNNKQRQVSCSFSSSSNCCSFLSVSILGLPYLNFQKRGHSSEYFDYSSNTQLWCIFVFSLQV